MVKKLFSLLLDNVIRPDNLAGEQGSEAATKPATMVGAQILLLQHLPYALEELSQCSQFTIKELVLLSI